MTIIRKWLAGLLAACFAVAAQAATYTFSPVSPYDTIIDYTACNTLPAVPCINFPAQSNASGSFSVSTPFAPNFSGFFQPSSFTFNDGVNTYTSGDPNIRFLLGQVETDASGSIVAIVIAVEKWLSGTAPHTVGDRVSLVEFISSGFVVTGGRAASILAAGSIPAARINGAAPGSLQIYSVGVHNYTCVDLVPIFASDPDSCNSLIRDASSSDGWYGVATLSQSNATAVPTLNGTALLALMALMAGVAFMLRGRFARKF